MGAVDHVRRAIALARAAGPGAVRACRGLATGAREAAQVGREVVVALDAVAEDAGRLAGILRKACAPAREDETIHVRRVEVTVVGPPRPVPPGGTRYRVG